MAPKKKLSVAETRKLLPVIREFNKLSQAFVGLLSQKEERQKQHISKIKVMIDGIKIPQNTNSTLNIQAIDMNDTKITQKGEGAIHKRMKWEDDMRHRNRGTLL